MPSAAPVAPPAPPRRAAASAPPRRGTAPAVLGGCLLLLLAGALYAPLLSAPFVGDDPLLLGPRARAVRLPPLGALLAGSSPPLTVLSYVADRALGGGEPWAFRLTSLLLHLLVGLGVGLVLHRRVRTLGAALLAAGLLLFHPAALSAAGYVAGRSRLVETFGAVGVLLVWAYGRSRRGLPLVFSAQALAVFLCGPGAAVAAPWILLGEAAAGERRRLALRLSGLLAALLPGFLVRPPHVEPLAFLGAGWGDLLAPPAVPVRRAVGAPFWPGVGFTLLVLTAAAALWRRRPPLGAALAGLALTVAAATLLRPPGPASAVRLPYLALLGLALAAGHLAAALSRPRLRRLAAAAGLLVLPVAAGATLRMRAAYAAPMDFWTAALRTAPRSALAHQRLALVLSAAGRLAEAQAHLERALQEEPANALAHYNLAYLLHKWGRYEEAERHYREAVRRKPRFREAWVNWSLLRAERNDPAGAARLLERARRRRPRDLAVLANLAAHYEAAGRKEEAAALYREIHRIHPRYARAPLRLGLLAFQAGDFAAAARWFAAARSADPDLGEAYLYLGQSLARAGRPLEAARAYESFLERWPRNHRRRRLAALIRKLRAEAEGKDAASPRPRKR